MNGPAILAGHDLEITKHCMAIYKGPTSSAASSGGNLQVSLPFSLCVCYVPAPGVAVLAAAASVQLRQVFIAIASEGWIKASAQPVQVINEAFPAIADYGFL